MKRVGHRSLGLLLPCRSVPCQSTPSFGETFEAVEAVQFGLWMFEQFRPILHRGPAEDSELEVEHV